MGDTTSIALGSLLLAGLSGVLMAIQGSINASLGKVIGIWEATFIVHVIAVIVLFLMLFRIKLGDGSFSNINQAPWYSYLGGVISVFIIYLVALSIPKLGAANATTAIIIGQVLMAGVIDYFGLFGLKQLHFGWQHVLGILFLAIGAKLLLNDL
ncbi:DMT family transporter [Anaerosinus sp.]|uniref:DMT family transporter n=1 Tax=Selenobaculum sp. TaxID=3074374 RepID=UPI003AB30568